MIAWAKLPNGRVFHAFDMKWPYARWYRSICGRWYPYWKLGGEEISKKCKACMKELGRHQRRRGSNSSTGYEMLEKTNPDSSPRTNPSLRVRPDLVFCPDCGATMIKRVPKPDDIWFAFWGCRNFPDCRRTRAILPDGSVEPEVWELDNLDWI